VECSQCAIEKPPDTSPPPLLQCAAPRPTQDPVRNALPPQMVHMIDMMLSSAQVRWGGVGLVGWLW